MIRQATTSQEQDYLRTLEELHGWSEERTDQRGLELLDDEHPYHREAVEDFNGFLLANDFITVQQYNSKLDELYGPEEAKNYHINQEELDRLRDAAHVQDLVEEYNESG